MTYQVSCGLLCSPNAGMLYLLRAVPSSLGMLLFSIGSTYIYIYIYSYIPCGGVLFSCGGPRCHQTLKEEFLNFEKEFMRIGSGTNHLPARRKGQNSSKLQSKNEALYIEANAAHGAQLLRSAAEETKTSRHLYTSPP